MSAKQWGTRDATSGRDNAANGRALPAMARVKDDEQAGRDVLFTYRYLRGAMIALLLMLLFSVIYQTIADGGCFLGSISAYYFTPVRTIFVGSLFALGILLIAHKARTVEEDVLLDFSGLMAIIVAAVPTSPDSVCGPATGLPAAEVSNAVRNNIWAIIVITLGAMLTRWWLTRKAPEQSATPLSRIPSYACGAIIVVELGFFLLKRDSFITQSHTIAAVTMVLGIIAVMLLNALRQPDDPRSQRFRRSYFGLSIALAIALALAVGVSVFVGFGYFVLIAEVVIIVLFIAFWVVQTTELWDSEPEELRRQVQSVGPAATPAGNESRSP